MDNKTLIDGYSSAADLIESRWRRNGYTPNEDGNGYCLIGGISVTMNNSYFNLPIDLLSPLEGRLKRYPCYWVARGCVKLFGDPGYRDSSRYRRQRSIEGWNDAPWRRKKTVVKVLRKLVKDMQAQEIKKRTFYLESERIKLQTQIEALKQEIKELKSRILLLESENKGLWDRVKDSRSISHDKEQLDELEAMLAIRWNELQTMEPVT